MDTDTDTDFVNLSSYDLYSWLCGTQSPCADIGPTFPGNAEYYFKLEFSNR